jgi:hypothetical protein
MLITIANHAWIGWTYYKPELYVRGLVDGKGMMVEHRKGQRYWWDMSILKFSDRLVVYFYCGTTSSHMYLKASYDYFWSRTWPFITYPVPEDYEEPVQEDNPNIQDQAVPDPDYEWSSNVTTDINQN